MIRALLLDAHGTLLELEPPAPALRARLAERHAIDVSLAQASVGIAAEIAYYRAHLHHGRDAASVATLRGRCGEVLREALALPLSGEETTAVLMASLVFRPFPEVSAVLAGLRAGGVRLVVASNWDASLPETLERSGLLSHLDGVVTSAACGMAKPSPELFHEALRVAGAAAREAVHVGDRLVEDVDGARAAGIEPVLVTRGSAPAPAGVLSVRSLAELPAMLAAAGS